MKEKVNRSMSWSGYLLLAIASNGIFGIYLANDNPGTSLFIWIVLGLIGVGILIVKTLRFKADARKKIMLADLLYLFILIAFGLIQLPRGINILIGSVLAVLYLYYSIDQKYLVKLE